MKIATALLTLASFGAALGFAGQANPPASGTDQSQTTKTTKSKKHHTKKSKKGAASTDTSTAPTK